MGPASMGAEPRGAGGYPHPDAPDLGQPPSRGAPTPGRTTYRFCNQEPHYEDQASAQPVDVLDRVEHMGVTPVPGSEAASLREGADELACPIHAMVRKAIEVSWSMGPDNDIAT